MKKNKGFSLIELIIAIAILVILTGLLAPQFMRYMEKAREAKDLQTLDTFYQAVKVALADEEVYKEVQHVLQTNASSSDSSSAVLVLTDMLQGKTGAKGLSLKTIFENADGTSLLAPDPIKFSAEVASAFGGSSETLWHSKAVLDVEKNGGSNSAVYVLLDTNTFEVKVWIGQRFDGTLGKDTVLGPDSTFAKSAGTTFYIAH